MLVDERFASIRGGAARLFATAGLLGVVLVCITGPADKTLADGATLKNGITFEGKPVPILGLTNEIIQRSQGPIPIHPILMIYNGMTRYFVPHSRVADIDNSAVLSRFETFTLKQQKSSQRITISSLGTVIKGSKLDGRGWMRISVQVRTPKGLLRREDIVLGVTEITPQHVTLTALTHKWEYKIATTSVKAETLDKLLRAATDPDKPEDRLAIARFYLQAGMYLEGDAELEAIAADFPELKKTTTEVALGLRQQWARQLLIELRRRQAAGQHRLVYEHARLFPVEKMSAAVLKDVKELIEGHQSEREGTENILLLLGELQADLVDPAQRKSVMPLRSEIRQQLDYESLPRLDAFVKLSTDEGLSAAEKLALAYSGWVLGSANAITDLDTAIRLWHARFLIGEYVRSNDPSQQERLLKTLEGTEGIGPQVVARMIPLLPPLIETINIVPGVPQRFELSAEQTEVPVAYSVLLPQEYSPHHQYPMIVALRSRVNADEENKAYGSERQLRWWGGTKERPGQSQRRGYIVIAPEYLPNDAKTYDFSAAAHHVVIESIRDARKRFSVDSDRVFLTGHSMGGDAAFDIGMAHPDLFAGVIPITGMCDNYCKWYWENCDKTAWYVVSGELDRDSLSRNAMVINRMMRHKYDIIYAEYVARGHESYYEEIHRLFDWMDIHRRVKYVKDIDVRVLRPHDNHFYWMRVEGLPKNVHRASVVIRDRKSRVSPMSLVVKVTAGNSIFITRSGASRHTLWLSPEFIDFEKRIAVRIKGRPKFNNFVSPEIGVMLDDLQVRGDRQKLYWARLDFN